jgi:hypothetical protein
MGACGDMAANDRLHITIQPHKVGSYTLGDSMTRDALNGESPEHMTLIATVQVCPATPKPAASGPKRKKSFMISYSNVLTMSLKGQ